MGSLVRAGTELVLRGVAVRAEHLEARRIPVALEPEPVVPIADLTTVLGTVTIHMVES